MTRDFARRAVMLLAALATLTATSCSPAPRIPPAPAPAPVMAIDPPSEDGLPPPPQ